MIEQTTIAGNIGRLIRQAETSTDLALADTARALSECARSRAVLRLPATEGQRGIIGLGKSIDQLIGAQAGLRHAHTEARSVGSTYGFAPDEADCPWPEVGQHSEEAERRSNEPATSAPAD